MVIVRGEGVSPRVRANAGVCVGSVSVCACRVHVCVTSGVRKSSLPVQVCPHVTAVRSRLRIPDVWHHKICGVASFSAWQQVDAKNRSNAAG